MELSIKNCYRVRPVTVIKKESDFIVKPIIIVVDEMNEVMQSSNYRASDAIKQAIGSIARLGRAAACHLCLATQRPSGDVISSDLKNNIAMATILGNFGTSESTLTLDDDYSANAKPEIKGRGFIKNGTDVIEYQSFFVDKDTTIFKEKHRFYGVNEDSGEPIVEERNDMETVKEVSEMSEEELQKDTPQDINESEQSEGMENDSKLLSKSQEDDKSEDPNQDTLDSPNKRVRLTGIDFEDFGVRREEIPERKVVRLVGLDDDGNNGAARTVKIPDGL